VIGLRNIFMSVLSCWLALRYKSTTTPSTKVCLPSRRNFPPVGVKTSTRAESGRMVMRIRPRLKPKL